MVSAADVAAAVPVVSEPPAAEDVACEEAVVSVSCGLPQDTEIPMTKAITRKNAVIFFILLFPLRVKTNYSEMLWMYVSEMAQS